MSDNIKMSLKEGQICRLCLKVAKDEYEIDRTMKEMFEILSLKLNLDITKNPIICQDCMEAAKTCLKFKYACINTEETILSFSIDKKLVQQSIKVIYEERRPEETVFYENFNVCRFCMTRLEKSNFFSFIALTSDSMFEMFSRYIMLEMDFNTIDNPIACASCKESFEGYFKFLLNCLDMEKKIIEYCKEKGTDIMGQVKLSNVLRFVLRNVIEYPDICSQTSKIKQEHIACISPEVYRGYVLTKQEELEIKDEVSILNEYSYRNISEIKLDQYGDTFYFDKCNKGTKPIMACLNSNKSNTERHTYRKNIMEENSTTCTDGTIERINVSRELAPELVNHGDESETDMYKCTSKFEVNQQQVLKKQGSISKGDDMDVSLMYNCSLCAYEAKRKSNLTRHMSVHKDISEIKMYKCSLCAYEAKQNCTLTRHKMLVHRDVSELKVFKCSLCTYMAKQKSNLKKHMLVHKQTSEMKMHRCSLCAYESKHKGNLRTHMLVHEEVSELKMYKCTLCAYKAKQKGNLIGHALIHKNVSDIKMYKCYLCNYEAKLKSNLKMHMLVHKDASEIKMYKCTMCSHESKRKYHLNAHMRGHN